MKTLRNLWPLSLVALWGATSSFINLGVSSDTVEVSTPQDSPPPSSQPASECPKCERGCAFITVDGLLWKAQESGLSFAVKTEDTGSQSAGSGKIKNLDFKWDYGFRAGLGFNIPHGNWDTYFNYTWFHDTAKGSTNNGGGMRVFPNFASAVVGTGGGGLVGGGLVIFTPTTANASAHWKLHLNVLDWELGKLFVPFEWFSLRPFAGVKAAWVHQDYDIDYNGLSIAATDFDYTTSMKNNYWGVGPRAGFNSQFWMGHGFSIFGNAAISLVYGKFKLTHEESGVLISTGTTTDFADLSDHYTAGRAITDLQLGLRWDTKFCKDKFHFAISAGWEQHIFFGQGEFMHFVDPANAGHFTQDHADLTLQGGTLSAKFEF